MCQCCVIILYLASPGYGKCARRKTRIFLAQKNCHLKKKNSNESEKCLHFQTEKGGGGSFFFKEVKTQGIEWGNFEKYLELMANKQVNELPVKCNSEEIRIPKWTSREYQLSLGQGVRPLCGVPASPWLEGGDLNQWPSRHEQGHLVSQEQLVTAHLVPPLVIPG